MDILNFISWIKGKRVVTTVDPNQTLLPVGLKDNRRDDGYLAGAISVADFITQLGPGQVGPQGPQGIQGIQGIQGSQGIQGIQGNQGPQGTAGNSVTILGSVADYAAFLAGPGASPGAAIGDAWILLSDGSLMSWNGSVWFDAGDIQGPPGATGATGAQGIQGNQGIQGVQGIQGIAGPAGLPGLFAQTALSTPVTFATGEQTLFGSGVGTLSVPANGFQVGDSFTCKLCGPITCANNQNFKVRVKSNGTVLIDTGTIQLNQTTNNVFDIAIDFTITKIGGAGVAELFANSLFTYNQDSDNKLEGFNNNIINNTTFDTTTPNTLNVTAEWLSNNVINSVYSQNFVLTKVY